ncbi:SDR family NAD(P)-dependent oxidoreductase [Staphylococcus xylosus]|uniref:SDR family NAD(P)-dependent oxidoreductase n=1 Tax=Staphylococcus xylosus TaxID=1288 RepID=UPI00049A5628|nr:SDR family NAD(P)-dependent oxidoreductase [Staphylococcus xylosus]AID42722.1 Oxidoreductase, short-chain dehydrogenase/reductase family [Staphylococcus xylosus]MBE6179564.1 SDR family NAD(P)-dependent oxidoreductase [Staphylococcus xylosus]MBM6638154.1 SDR family NAD(P)-dependent oxidoreductase [Staphylococcus xylosus]MBU6131791.1 SDR family NAD(P)-dependent oxidoreductase [Staphylococcus xylosus]MCE4993761.1 SDR family NAD(P)-dependent oxidoreductase [Staphylococcus xylosus]
MIGKHYVLTGGTSGLGQSLLEILLSKQVHVTVLARNPQKIKKKYDSSLLTVIKCDLQSQEQILNLKNEFNEKAIDGIIYSSGLGYFKSIEQHSTEEMLETYNLNVVNFNTLLTTLQPFFSQFPTIVGIGSQSAFLTQAYAAHYGASKAAFNQVLNALRIEKPNYHVLTVNTGPIATPFHEKADPSLSFAQRYKSIMLDPDELAHKIIIGMLSKKQEINEPKWMHLFLRIYQIAPRFVEKHFTFLFKNKI